MAAAAAEPAEHVPVAAAHGTAGPGAASPGAAGTAEAACARGRVAQWQEHTASAGPRIKVTATVAGSWGSTWSSGMVQSGGSKVTAALSVGKKKGTALPAHHF